MKQHRYSCVGERERQVFFVQHLRGMSFKKHGQEEISTGCSQCPLFFMFLSILAKFLWNVLDKWERVVKNLLSRTSQLPKKNICKRFLKMKKFHNAKIFRASKNKNISNERKWKIGQEFYTYILSSMCNGTL